MIDITETLGGRNGPSVGRRSVGSGLVQLVPPAIENGKIERPVEGGFLPRCAARLHRPTRIVEPHIGTLIHQAGHPDVVVLDEREPVPNVGLQRKIDDLAHDLFTGRVRRMGLARKYELHWMIRMQQQTLQTIRVPQQQGGALVRGEAASEANGEHTGIKGTITPRQI